MTPRPLPIRWRTTLLVLAMMLAIGGIAALGVMDERSLVVGVRLEISREQRVLATVLATELREKLEAIGGDGPCFDKAAVEDGVWLFGDDDDAVAVEPRKILHGEALSDDGDHRVLLWSSAAHELRTLAGGLVSIPSVSHAVAGKEGNAWLTAKEAEQLGLPEDVAVAGLASFHTNRLGDWTVAVVSSAQRHSGREARRYVRTIVMVALASLVVLGFGLVLLRTQRQERALERALAREEHRGQLEAQLAREGRAATMMTFAAGIAHELSTPLGVIAMRAEQLENGADDDRARRGARAITEQVGRIHDQARRFLAIARGASPLRERFPVTDVLHSAASRVEHRFEHAGVKLKIETCDDPPWVHGDARLLEHALTNLLLNACDASSAGGVVGLLVKMADGVLAIEVRDRGVGIDPALVARLRPFFSTKAEGGGHGPRPHHRQ
jgi:two-component system NtrC family sensor kinase